MSALTHTGYVSRRNLLLAACVWLLAGDEFSIETIDKEQNGEAAGTKVVMHIPVVRPEEINLSEEA